MLHQKRQGETVETDPDPRGAAPDMQRRLRS